MISNVFVRIRSVRHWEDVIGRMPFGLWMTSARTIRKAHMRSHQISDNGAPICNVKKTIWYGVT